MPFSLFLLLAAAVFYGDDLEPAFRENGRDDRHEAARLKEILATQVVGEGEVKRPAPVASGAILTF